MSLYHNLYGSEVTIQMLWLTAYKKKKKKKAIDQTAKDMTDYKCPMNQNDLIKLCRLMLGKVNPTACLSVFSK